jgi:hypothetical protein
MAWEVGSESALATLRKLFPIGQWFLKNGVFPLLIGQTKMKGTNENHSSEQILLNSEGTTSGKDIPGSLRKKHVELEKVRWQRAWN